MFTTSIANCPKDIGAFRYSHPLDLLLSGRGRMRRRWHYHTRRHNKPLDCLSGDKRGAAVDVCALVIALFGRVSKIATCAGVSGEMAFWTVKHGEHLI